MCFLTFCIVWKTTPHVDIIISQWAELRPETCDGDIACGGSITVIRAELIKTVVTVSAVSSTASSDQITDQTSTDQITIEHLIYLQADQHYRNIQSPYKTDDKTDGKVWIISTYPSQTLAEFWTTQCKWTHYQLWLYIQGVPKKLWLVISVHNSEALEF